MIKKINLTKSDTAESAVIKLLKTKEDEVVLVIPNFSKLAHSIDNFEFLKKEAEESGKSIAIESVDDMVVEFAKRSDLEAVNPFFQDKKSKIIQETESYESEREGKPLIIKDIPLNEIEEDIGNEYRKNNYISWVVSASLLVLAVPGIYFGYKYLPEANIKIITKKMDWEYKDLLLVDKSLSAADLEKRSIPGQIISRKENAQLFYPATSNKRVNRKATGTVTIYNNYGTESQQLVASTRLATVDSKIYRLVEPVTIPGAKKEGNKIIPSSIAVKVIADRGGEEYNIGPVEKFTIPGFAKDKKKFDGFYAVSTESMKGGFVGDSAYPSDKDITEAKKSSLLALEDNIRATIKNQAPEGFKIINGASKLNVIKQNVDSNVNEENKFSVFTEAEMSVLIFSEKDALSLLNQKANQELSANLKPKTSSLEYGEPKADFVKGIMSLPVVYKSQLEYPIDKEKLRRDLVGKSEVELKAMLFSIPGLLSANISFWPPFLVSSVPEKFDIEIE